MGRSVADTTLLVVELVLSKRMQFHGFLGEEFQGVGLKLRISGFRA